MLVLLLFLFQVIPSLFASSELFEFVNWLQNPQLSNLPQCIGEESPAKPSKLFSNSDSLKLKLNLNVKKLLEKKNKTDESKLSELKKDICEETMMEYQKTSFKIKACLRGGTRLDSCTKQPPLKIHFLEDNPVTKNTKDYKLVLPCYGGNKISLNDNKEWDHRVLREYTLYKILEASGLEHFKVRLVELNLNGKKMPAFFLEKKKEVVNRYQGKGIEGFELAPPIENSISPLYRLLSSNDDYFYHNNIQAYKTADGSTKGIIYDFDQGSLVGPNLTLSKAGIDPTYGLWYQNLKPGDSQLKTVLSREKAIFQAIEDSPLSKSDKSNFVKYYQEVMSRLKKIDQSPPP